MAEETSKKRSKEEQNVEAESEDEMIGPLPVQPSKPKKKKGNLLVLLDGTKGWFGGSD